MQNSMEGSSSKIDFNKGRMILRPEIVDPEDDNAIDLPEPKEGFARGTLMGADNPLLVKSKIKPLFGPPPAPESRLFPRPPAPISEAKLPDGKRLFAPPPPTFEQQAQQAEAEMVKKREIEQVAKIKETVAKFDKAMEKIKEKKEIGVPRVRQAPYESKNPEIQALMARSKAKAETVLSGAVGEKKAKEATQRMKDRIDERTTQKQVQKEVEGLEKKKAAYQIKDAGLNKKTQNEFRTTPKVVVDYNYKKEIPIEVDPKKVLVEERYAEARANYIKAYKDVYPKNTEELDEILPPPRFTLFSRAKENLKRLHADVLDAEREREEFGIGEKIRNNVAYARERSRLKTENQKLNIYDGATFNDEFTESLTSKDKVGITSAIEEEVKRNSSQDLANTITEWELSEERKDPEFKADFWFKDQKAIQKDFQVAAEEAQNDYVALFRNVFNVSKKQRSDEEILGMPLPKLSFKMIFSKDGKKLKELHDIMVKSVKIAVE